MAAKDRFSLGFLNSVVDDTPNILDFINIEYDTMEQHECVAAGLEPCPAGFVDSGTGELPFTFAYRQVTNAEIPDITGSGGVPVGPAFEIPADMLRRAADKCFLAVPPAAGGRAACPDKPTITVPPCP